MHTIAFDCDVFDNNYITTYSCTVHTQIARRPRAYHCIACDVLDNDSTSKNMQADAMVESTSSRHAW
jgi:hypothetical protein